MSRVLVIDDDELIRRLFRQMLAQQGHRVVEALDGKEGVALYQKEPADLVVVDLLMPEKDGLETIMDLRRINRHLKIIAISEGLIDGVDFLPIAKKLGAQYTFQKPFNPEEVQAAIRELLGPVHT